LKVVELTTGSGLVGMSVVLANEANTLLGLDVDEDAVETARANARMLLIEDRCRFECADLWSNHTSKSLRALNPNILICNPPYIPEPADTALQVEAGAGPDGTAHLMRTIELLQEVQPESAALSWCSLSDPAKVIDAAHRAGYALEQIFIVAIADGEYSGSVHEYLRALPHAYICETQQTLEQVAPDTSARFAYLLMAGSFARRDSSNISEDIEKLCSDFAINGLESLSRTNLTIPSRSWLLDRWDEIALRAILH